MNNGMTLNYFLLGILLFIIVTYITITLLPHIFMAPKEAILTDDMQNYHQGNGF